MADLTHVKIDEIEAIDGLGQEEVYVAPEGSGTLHTDDCEYQLDSDHIARVGPDAKRKVTPGSEGIRLLIVGATPGEPYDTGGRL